MEMTRDVLSYLWSAHRSQHSSGRERGLLQGSGNKTVLLRDARAPTFAEILVLRPAR